MNEIDDKLRTIVHTLFGVAPEAYGEGLSVDDVDAWDSVAHVTLVLSVEQAFGVQFSPEEAAELTSVRMIKLTLAEKGAVRA